MLHATGTSHLVCSGHMLELIGMGGRQSAGWQGCSKDVILLESPVSYYTTITCHLPTNIYVYTSAALWNICEYTRNGSSCSVLLIKFLEFGRFFRLTTSYLVNWRMEEGNFEKNMRQKSETSVKLLWWKTYRRTRRLGKSHCPRPFWCVFLVWWNRFGVAFVLLIKFTCSWENQ